MRCERVLVDALGARMVRESGSLDVVVASNLVGDVLTDLAAARRLRASSGRGSGARAPGGEDAGLERAIDDLVAAQEVLGREAEATFWRSILLAQAQRVADLQAELARAARAKPRLVELARSQGEAGFVSSDAVEQLIP